MRILLISPSLPLPFRATEARWLHVVTRGLADRGHEVTCISCTGDPPDVVGAAAALAETHGFRLRHVPLSVPEPAFTRKTRSFLVPKSEVQRSPGFLETVREELALAPDVVHAEHVVHARSLLEIPQLALYVHCLETVDWAERRDLGRRDRVERHLTGRAIRHVLAHARRAIAMTERLRDELVAANPRLETAVAPMGLDLDLYEPVEPAADPIAGLIGSMNWYPSRGAAERLLRLWPAIRARVPAARLLIAGWEAERYLGHRFPLAGAELVGAVPQVRDWFSRVGMLVYPSVGGTGMKVKVLESMAYAVPVLSDAVGFEGIATGPGDAFLAHSDEEFVEVAAGALADTDRRRNVGRAGRALLERDHSAQRAVDGLLDAYATLLPAAAAAA